MDPEAERELRADIAADLEFQDHSAKVAQIGEFLGLSLDPADPRSRQLVSILDSLGMDTKNAAMMLSQKADGEARSSGRDYSPEAVYAYVARHADRLRRPDR